MKSIMKYGAVVLLATLPAGVQAGQHSAAVNNEKTWTGDLTAVSPQDKTLTGEHWLSSKTFHLGEDCVISTVDKKNASLSDLRAGEDIRVRYRDVEGVLVADRVTEKPLHYTGRIHALDERARTVTMNEAALYKPFREPRTFQVAENCQVKLGNGESGTLAALHPGDRILVLYEHHGGKSVAYRIKDKSMTFTGKLDAINLSARTVAAKGMSTEKQFNVADHCRVILNHEKTGHLKDLALGQQYQFTYTAVKGVNVLDRIAPAREGSASTG